MGKRVGGQEEQSQGRRQFKVEEEGEGLESKEEERVGKAVASGDAARGEQESVSAQEGLAKQGEAKQRSVSTSGGLVGSSPAITPMPDKRAELNEPQTPGAGGRVLSML